MQAKVPSKIKKLINSGVAEYNQKKYFRAVKQYQKALSIQPKFTIAINNLASAYLKVNRIDEALKLLEKLVKDEPEYHLATFNLGYAYFLIGKYDEAIAILTRLIQVDRKFHDAYLILGICYVYLANYNKAIETYLEGIKYFPARTDLLNNLGNVYKDLGNSNIAMNIFKEVFKLNTKSVEALLSMALLYYNLDDFEKAAIYFKKVISIEKKNLLANTMMATIYSSQHKYLNAIAQYRTLMKLEKNDPNTLDSIYDEYRYLCDWEQADKIARKLKFREGASPYSLMLAFDDPQLELKAAEREAEKIEHMIRRRLPARIWANPSKRRIRLGIMSADLRNHPVGHLMKGYFDNYDRAKFELFTYSWGEEDESVYNRIAQEKSEHYTNMRGWSNFQISEKIYDDAVDILIDLMGYTDNYKPDILALKLAPVQILYLGYPGTMGSKFMDYLIADNIVIPTNYEHFYKEKILRLPNSFMLFDDTQNIVDCKTIRSDYDLPSDKFILCSFCGPVKIDENCFAAWMEILKSCEEAVLLLRYADSSIQSNLITSARAYGVEPHRIIFGKRIEDKIKHLERLSLCDLALDTLNYGGHTTTIDCLQANLPVISKMGKHFAGRVAASILINAGLPECVVANDEGYISKTIELVKGKAKLEILKKKLKVNKSKMPFFSTKRYVRDLEKILVASLRTSADSIGVSYITT